MEERRKTKRKYMVFFGRVSDRNTSQVLGNVADITPAGAMVISGHPLALDEEYQMRLDLPEHIFGIDHLDFDARSIWGAPDIDPTYFNTGFEIINITPEKRAVIEKIIQEYGIRG